MFLVMRLSKKWDYTETDVSQIDPESITDDMISQTTSIVREHFLRQQEDSGQSADAVAKSKEFVEKLELAYVNGVDDL